MSEMQTTQGKVQLGKKCKQLNMWKTGEKDHFSNSLRRGGHLYEMANTGF